MDSRLYNKIYEHFQHLIPRIDFEAGERLAKNEEEAKKRALRHKSKRYVADFIDGLRVRSVQNADGSIDVKGGVNLSRLGLYSITEIATFGIVEGNFNCNENQLTSLEGAPKKCVQFGCWSNKLTSLKYLPECKSLYCQHNQLTSLEGAPRECEVFICFDNQLTSLEGAPKKCTVFDCQDNQLTSLEGAPIEYRVFYCGGNRVPEDQLLKEHEERIKNMK